MTASQAAGRPPKQLLHLVFGGELTSLADLEFANLDAIDMVGIYPSYAEAYKAWKAVAQQTVDQRAHALFHRPHPPPARPQRHPAAAFVKAFDALPGLLIRAHAVASPRAT